MPDGSDLGTDGSVWGKAIDRFGYPIDGPEAIDRIWTRSIGFRSLL